MNQELEPVFLISRSLFIEMTLVGGQGYSVTTLVFETGMFGYKSTVRRRE